METDYSWRVEPYSSIHIGDYLLIDIQTSIFKIMLEFERICRKYQIKYILDGGTMLGAIRHSGFIPWDDDADFAMLRKDYNKFCKVCKKELGADFYLETKGVNKKYPYAFAKLRLNGTVYKETFLNNLNVHPGIWIDIFPIDKTSKLTFKIQSKLSLIWRSIRWHKTKEIICDSKHRQLLNFLAFIFPYWFININEELCIRLLNIFPIKTVSKLCHPGPGKKIEDISFYKYVVKHLFWGHSFFVPIDYNLWLEQRYKNPFKLPQVSKRVPSHSGGEVKL